MKVRTFKEISKELENIEFNPTDKNVVTGEAYEDWTKTKFIKVVDNKE